jgi:predicted Zn-dependent peptidase
MDYKRICKDGYRFHFIKTDKFKTVLVRVIFKSELTKEKITPLELLAGVLSTSTLDCPTLKELTLKKEDLYQLNYGCSSITSGNFVLFKTEARFIHEHYTENGMNEKSLRFFLDSIFHPNVHDAKFDKNAFLLEKHEYMEFLEGKDDSPSRYASVRFNSILGRGTSLEIDRSGSMEALEPITEASLYETYLDVFQNSSVDVFFIGNMEEEEVTSILDEYLAHRKEESTVIPLELSLLVDERIDQIDEKDYQQSKLLMGFKIEHLTDFERMYVLPVYNFILGADSDSLLFKNVREKHSLCYDIHSVTLPIYSAFKVSAGIEAKDYNQTVSLVNEMIEKMKQGEFLDSDLEKVKLNYKTSYKETLDDPSAILNNYETHEYRGYDLLEDRMVQIDKVTREMVIDLANKVKLVVVYFLEGTHEKNRD